VIATAPKSKAYKPLRQTLFMLEANMKKVDERWDKMQMSVDMLFAKLGSQEEVQSQMAVKLNLTA
jgi:chromosome segregation ATPase